MQKFSISIKEFDGMVIAHANEIAFKDKVNEAQVDNFKSKVNSYDFENC